MEIWILKLLRDNMLTVTVQWPKPKTAAVEFHAKLSSSKHPHSPDLKIYNSQALLILPYYFAGHIDNAPCVYSIDP